MRRRQHRAGPIARTPSPSIIARTPSPSIMDAIPLLHGRVSGRGRSRACTDYSVPARTCGSMKSKRPHPVERDLMTCHGVTAEAI